MTEYDRYFRLLNSFPDIDLSLVKTEDLKYVDYFAGSDAYRIDRDDQLLMACREELLRRGYEVQPLIDRVDPDSILPMEEWPDED